MRFDLIGLSEKAEDESLQQKSFSKMSKIRFSVIEGRKMLKLDFLVEKCRINVKNRHKTSKNKQTFSSWQKGVYMCWYTCVVTEDKEPWSSSGVLNLLTPILSYDI
jgi:hypothetical protein